MKTSFSYLVLLVFLFVGSTTSHAQNVNPVLAMDIASTSIANNASADGLPLITDSTVYSVSMNVSLYDTTNIQSIEVKVGTTAGGSDLFNHSYVYDVFGNLGNARTYSRNGFQVTLGLGSLIGIDSYFSEVRIQFMDGTYSDPISFNR